MGNRKGLGGIFRVIAGGYLIYLGVKLIRNGLLGGTMQGNARILGVVFSVLFIAAGAFFVVQALGLMAKQSGESEEEQGEESAETEAQPEEEPMPAGRSLFDRAGFGASAYDDEDDESEEDDT